MNRDEIMATLIEACNETIETVDLIEYFNTDQIGDRDG